MKFDSGIAHDVKRKKENYNLIADETNLITKFKVKCTCALRKKSKKRKKEKDKINE